MTELSVKIFEQWQKSPLKFIEDVWGLTPQKTKDDPFIRGENMTWQQYEIIKAVERAINNEASRRISVASGHGIGKGTVLSWIILWFLTCHKNAQIPCTAPTTEQMNDALWKEISKQMNAMPKVLANKFDWTFSHIRVKENPREWFARAKTARQESPEALAGVHGDYVMLVCDEACYDEQTEVLTDSGFKLFKDLKKTDKVLSMKENEEAVFEKPNKILSYTGERDMFFYQKRGCDFAVTANHKMLYSTPKVKKNRLKEIRDLDKSGNIYFPRKVNYQLNNEEFFTVKEFKSKRKLYKKLTFKMKDWVELVAWYLSEGHIMKGCNYVNISQSKKYNPENHRNIELLLEKMGLRYYSNDKQIIVSLQQIAEELKKYGNSFKNKRVPNYIKKSKYANYFLNIFTLGDGYQRKNRRIFYSSSKGMIDDLQEMLYLIGSAGTISKRKKEDKKWYRDHFIKQKEDAYVLVERQPTKIKFSNKGLTIKRHKGIVYCVTTNYGNVFVRRNGRCMWSGNSGVPDNVFETAEGALTNDNTLVILTSNPTRTEGYFYDTHHSDKKNWQTFQFSSLDSPIVTKAFVDRWVEKYGENSDQYAIRVKGEFPKENSVDKSGYVSLLSESDLNYTTNSQMVGSPVLGVDPAGEGNDKTAWVKRDNYKAVIVADEKVSNSKTIAEKTGTIKVQSNIPEENVFVDNFGVGANVAQELGLSGMRVNAVNVGEKADDNDRFVNKRAEAYWRLREWLKRGGQLSYDERWKELLNIKFKRTLSGKIQIKSKQEMRKEGIPSPNFADALMLTFIQEEYHRPARVFIPDNDNE